MQAAESLLLNDKNVDFMGTRFIEWIVRRVKHTHKMSTLEFNYCCNLSRRRFRYYHWLTKVGIFIVNVFGKHFFHIPKFYKMMQPHFYASKSPKVQLKLFPKIVRWFSGGSFKNQVMFFAWSLTFSKCNIYLTLLWRRLL